MSHDSRLASLARCCFAFFFLWISLATNCFYDFAQQFAHFSSSSHLVVSSTNSLGDSMRSGGNSLILKSCQLLAEILPTFIFISCQLLFEATTGPRQHWSSLQRLSWCRQISKWWVSVEFGRLHEKTGKILKFQLSSGGAALLGNSPWRWKPWRDRKQWNCNEVKCSFQYKNNFVFISNSSNFPNTEFQKI